MQAVKIKSIKKIGKLCGRYDIEVKDSHCFFANGILVHNSNGSVSWDIVNDKVYVNQRRFTIVEIEGHEHTFWKVVRRNNFFDKMKNIAVEFGAKENVTLYFEMLGPSFQDNIYHFTEHMVLAYDIKVDNKWIDSAKFFQACKALDIKTVPLLASNVTLREWLGGETVQAKSNGKSALYDTLREGIVIKPAEEQFSYELSGRLFIKQRDPVYLDKSGH